MFELLNNGGQTPLTFGVCGLRKCHSQQEHRCLRFWFQFNRCHEVAVGFPRSLESISKASRVAARDVIPFGNRFGLLHVASYAAVAAFWVCGSDRKAIEALHLMPVQETRLAIWHHDQALIMQRCSQADS